MLENVIFPEKMNKSTFKQLMEDNRNRLYQVQRKCRKKKLPVMIVFEGWDTTGKTSTIQELASHLDPRYYKNHPIRAARAFELKRPWMYRFWVKTPRRGEWALFDRSWYGRVLVERVDQITPESRWRRSYQEINEFEKQLTDDGTVIIKFFLHITKKMQLKRFLKLLEDPYSSWYIQSDDWEQHAKYSLYVNAIEHMFTRTNSPYAPWHIIGASNVRSTRTSVLKRILDTLEPMVN